MIRRGTASLAQRIVQLAPAAQLMLHVPGHVMWQSPPVPHERLPLWPTPTSQVAPASQTMLHESVQRPVQVERAPHSNEQLVGPQLTMSN